MTAAGALSWLPVLRAQTNVYWDTNGSTIGSAKYNFNWTDSTTPTWSLSSTGSVTPASWSVVAAGTKIANFAANTASGIYRVTTSGSISNVGGMTFSSGTVTVDGTGTLNLSQTGAFTASSSGTSTISAVIAGGFGFTKSGNGTLVLSGANTYTGLTTISAGALNIQNAAGLGTTAGGVSVTSGAALELQGGITIGAEALTLNGAGVTASPNGALRNVSGNNTYGGAITLGSTSTIKSDAGTLTLSGAIGGTGMGLVYDGAGNINQVGAVSTGAGGTLTKNGTGTVSLNVNSTYTGATVINSGALNIRTTLGLGTNAAGTTVMSGGALELQGGLANTNAEALNLNGTGVNGGGALRNVFNNNTYNGAITLQSASKITSDSGTLTLSGGISGSGQNVTFGGAGSISVTSIIGTGAGSLTKTGNGTLTLTAANTYTGTTTIERGQLTLSTTGRLNGTTGTALTFTGTGAFTAQSAGLARGMGTLTFSAGDGAVFSDRVSGNDSITFSSFAARSAGATGLFAVDGTNGTQNKIVLTGQATGFINQGTYFTTIYPQTGNSTFAYYTGSFVRGLTYGTDANTASVAAAATIGANAGKYLRITGSITAQADGDGAGTNNTSIRTLELNGATDFTLGASQKLTLTEGGLLKVGNTAATISGGAGIQAGSSGTGTELVVRTDRASDQLTLSTPILQNGAATNDLTKSGNGTLILSASSASTYTGTTYVNAGTLNIRNGGSLGTTAGGTVVRDGAVLELQNNITVGAEALTLSGNGLAATPNGALRNVSGNNTYQGAVTLGSATTITSSTAGDTLTLSGGITGVAGSNLTFNGSGNISETGNIATGASTLTKSGSGTLMLSGSNSYTGGTTISAGSVEVKSSNALGTSGNVYVADGATLKLNGAGIVVGSGTDTVTLNGTSGGTSLLNTSASGSAQLRNNILLEGPTTISSGTTSGTNLLLGKTGSYSPGVSATDGSLISLGSNTLTFTGGAGTETQLEGTLTGTGGVVVNTSGTVHFNSAENRYTGTTNVQMGTLQVDTANNSWAPHDTTKQNFYGINGPLIIGTGSGPGATVQLGSGALAANNETLNPTSSLTINSDGTFNLNGNAQNIGKLVMNGGTINGSTGGLYLDYANTSVDVNLSGTMPASTITGVLSLTFHRDAATEGSILQSRTFNVGHTATNTNGDLIVSGTVYEGSIVKEGAGTMVLKNNFNQYQGTTTVNAGILNVQKGTDVTDLSSHKSSLGLAGSAGQDTIVNSGGTLQMQGGIAITHEALTLFGNGADGSQGALESKSGNNSWGTSTGDGLITLGAGGGRIGSTTAGDTFSILTNVLGTGSALTVSGAGNTTISGGILTSAGGTLIKEGTGTLTLSGSNDFTGQTTINAGVVVLDNTSSGLGTSATGTTVKSGAELQLKNTGSAGNILGETFLINGAGATASPNGALYNVAGNNTLNGQISLASGVGSVASTTIAANASTTLNLGGGIVSEGGTKNRALTVNVGTGANVNVNGAVVLGTVTNVAAVPGNSAAGISTGTVGTLTKTGAGLLTLGGGATSQLDGITLSVGGITIQNTNTFVQTGLVNTAAGTTLTINAGTSTNVTTAGVITQGMEMYVAASTTATFAGQLAGTGTLKKDGTGTLAFTTPESMVPGGYTIGSLVLNGGTLSLSAGVHLTVTDTLFITGDTILDFNGGANTWLTSANLAIASGVSVTVVNWFGDGLSTSGSTVWKVTNSSAGVYMLGGAGLTLGGSDIRGNSPLSQITFSSWTGHNYTGMTTTWVSGNHDGWFDHEIRPTMAPIPEPSTYGAIFLSSCVGLLGWRRFRRRQSSTEGPV